MTECNVAESEGGSERRYILDWCEILVSVRIMSVYKNCDCFYVLVRHDRQNINEYEILTQNIDSRYF